MTASTHTALRAWLVERRLTLADLRDAGFVAHQNGGGIEYRCGYSHADGSMATRVLRLPSPGGRAPWGWQTGARAKGSVLQLGDAQTAANVLICEGESDGLTVWRVLRADFNWAVIVVPGSAMVGADLANFIGNGARVVIASDGDEAGDKCAVEVRRVLLAAGVDVGLVSRYRPPEGEDLRQVVEQLEDARADLPADLVALLEPVEVVPDATPPEAEVVIESVERVKLRRLDVMAMVNTMPPEVPWLAEPLLVRGALTLLVGREGEGKSFVSLSLAIAVASGDPVAGFHPAADKVVYVDAENSAGEIHRRVRALGLPDGAAGRLAVVEAEGFDFRRDLGELDALIAAERPALVVLDSFRSLWGGSENDSDVVGPVLDKLRNLGRRHDTATLLVHHSGKIGGEYRGSTAIGAASELIFTLGREPDDDDKERRYLACRKSRPAREPGRRWLRLSTELGLTFLDECEPPDGHASATPGRPPRAQQELAPKVLVLVAEKGPMSRPDICRFVGRTPYDGTVRRVLSALVDRGDVEHRDGLFYPCQNANTLKARGILAGQSGPVLELVADDDGGAS